jgi:hypothetical protein
MRPGVEVGRRRGRIHAGGCVGFSQGGWVATLVTTRSDGINFVIVASGAARRSSGTESPGDSVALTPRIGR